VNHYERDEWTSDCQVAEITCKVTVADDLAMNRFLIETSLSRNSTVVLLMLLVVYVPVTEIEIHSPVAGWRYVHAQTPIISRFS